MIADTDLAGEQVRAALDLEPHPTCGYVAETCRDAGRVGGRPSPPRLVSAGRPGRQSHVGVMAQPGLVGPRDGDRVARVLRGERHGERML